MGEETRTVNFNNQYVIHLTNFAAGYKLHLAAFVAGVDGYAGHFALHTSPFAGERLNEKRVMFPLQSILGHIEPGAPLARWGEPSKTLSQQPDFGEAHFTDLLSFAASGI